MTEPMIIPSSPPFTRPCQPTCPLSSPPSRRSSPRPRPGGRDDPMRPLDIRILISICTTVPVLILIISVLSTAVCCWFFHRKWRRRDLCGKGGVIVLGDDLQRANQEGRLQVNVALVNQSETNYLERNQQMKPQTTELKENEQIESSTSKDPPLPLTEDGYAVLEPGGHDTKEYILPGHGTTNNQDHDYEELYWEPANQEEELLSQLSKLGLPVIHADCIELKEHLGNGEFGTVQRGLWSIQQGEGVTAWK